MILAMDGRGLEKQLGEGKVEEFRYFVAGPVGADLGQFLLQSLSVSQPVRPHMDKANATLGAKPQKRAL